MGASVKMNDTARVYAIMDRLKQRSGTGLPNQITDWIEIESDEPEYLKFEVRTRLSEFGHLVWLFFEVSESKEIMRVEFAHMCGWINLKENLDIDEFVLLLVGNSETGGFEASSGFIALQFSENSLFVYLRAIQHLLTRWNNDDIADVLTLQLFDLLNGVATEFPEPINLFEK